MKLIELELDDSIFDKFKGFLELLPEDKIKIREIYDDSLISFVADAEQKDIENILKNKNCHKVSRSKTVKIWI